MNKGGGEHKCYGCLIGKSVWKIGSEKQEVEVGIIT